MNKKCYRTVKLRFFVAIVFASVLYFSFSMENDDIIYYEVIFNDKTVEDIKLFDLRVIVIVYNRAHSLLRLLESLNAAEYFSDNIKLEVWIDRATEGKYDVSTFEAAKGFTFEHGEYEVFLQPHHVGIYGQWLTTWNFRANSSEIFVILEDDITVSKHFWRYLKTVHEKYDKNDNINGFALQGYTTTFSYENIHILQAPNSSFVFLYPVLGTWGFSPKNENWKNFLEWYIYGNARNTKPYVPGNIATMWYKYLTKEGKGSSMWEMWHIYYAWMNHEYTLYCNFADHAGLTTNWREKGLHSKMSEGPSNNLLTEWKKDYENLPDEPIYIDISGRKIKT